jgi:predicted MFS family arabinose efflux permease
MTATRIGSVVPDGQRRVFVYLLSALLVETLFFVVLSPLLPVYARQLHLSRLAAGVLSASYALGYGLAAVPAGALAGLLGQRRVSLAGVALVGCGCATFALSDQIVALDLARAATGVGAAGVWAGSIPWLVSLGGDGQRGRMIGLGFSAASAGACAGPAVGALATITGPRAAFLGLSVLIFALVASGIAASAGAKPARPVGSERELRSALSTTRAGRAIAMIALPSAGFGVAGVLLPLRLRGLGVAEIVIAMSYLMAAMIEVIANQRVGRWFDARGGRHVLRATLTGSSLCLVAIALPLPAPLLVIALVVTFPVLGSVWVPSLAQLAASLERGGGRPGAALGLFNLCWAVCQVAGSVGGAQLSHLGEAVPFLVLCALNLLGLRAAAGLV